MIGTIGYRRLLLPGQKRYSKISKIFFSAQPSTSSAQPTQGEMVGPVDFEGPAGEKTQTDRRRRIVGQKEFKPDEIDERHFGNNLKAMIQKEIEIYLRLMPEAEVDDVELLSEQDLRHLEEFTLRSHRIGYLNSKLTRSARDRRQTRSPKPKHTLKSKLLYNHAMHQNSSIRASLVTNPAVWEPLNFCVDLYYLRYQDPTQRKLVIHQIWEGIYDDWSPENFHRESALDRVFPEHFRRGNLIYLTPKARNTLDHLNPEHMYVIGGIFARGKFDDKNFGSHLRARELGIPTYKLPLDRYSTWLRGRKVLSLPMVMNLMCRVYGNGGHWPSALRPPADTVSRIGSAIGHRVSTDEQYEHSEDKRAKHLDDLQKYRRLCSRIDEEIRAYVIDSNDYD